MRTRGILFPFGGVEAGAEPWDTEKTWVRVIEENILQNKLFRYTLFYLIKEPCLNQKTNSTGSFVLHLPIRLSIQRFLTLFSWMNQC